MNIFRFIINIPMAILMFFLNLFTPALTIPPPKIITASLPSGTVDTPYKQTLEAEGDEPISWSIDGSLPTGLKLSGAEISGTPLASGTFSFTVKAGNSAGLSAEKKLSIAVDPIIKGSLNNYIADDIKNSKSWGGMADGVRIYMAEHGSYDVKKTGYDANFLVYKGKSLWAVFTECSTLPDVPKGKTTNYCAIVKDGEYTFKYEGNNWQGSKGPYWRVFDQKGKETLPCIRWNGSSAFASSTCSGILIHRGIPAKSGDVNKATSTGCLLVRTSTKDFYGCVGEVSGVINIIRDKQAL